VQRVMGYFHNKTGNMAITMCLYVRSLTEEERRQVVKLLRSHDAVTHRHARVILLSSQGKKVPQIMPLVGLSDRRIRDLLRGFNQHGVASLPHRKAPGPAPRCDANARAELVELLRRPPTDFGIESATWTGADLAAIAQAQGIVPALSPRTARREIERAGYRWQQAKRWSAKEPEYERKKAVPAVGRARRGQPGLGIGV
jgi:transposase